MASLFLSPAIPADGIGPAISGTHFFDEVHRMITQFSSLSTLELKGTDLTVAQVSAVARRADVSVALDAGTARGRVERSACWVADNPERLAAGFGTASHRRTRRTADLQTELIRFLNAGVVGKESSLPAGYAKASMLVRANTLMRGYSGIRWELLETIAKLIDRNLIPKLPLRGSITASGDLLPLAYIAGALTGRKNVRVVTLEGDEITATEALKRVGIGEPFDLKAKEGLALVNGTAVGSAVAATVCYDANILALLAVILSAMFCDAMQGNPEFTDPLTHELKGHPGQIESAAIMRFLLDGPTKLGRPTKLKQDRYALRTSPQWLGPQIEVIRAATHSIEREINSVNDNPLIDVDRGVVLYGGNFQGTPIGVSMDTIRIALAAIGKLVFAQITELVGDETNNGLPANLSAGADPSLDYGLKGAEIAMAAYCSELQHLANPVTPHAQSAEQHNQDVNSLGLISARKSAEAVEILKLMMATYMVALCQAIDVRTLGESLREGVEQAVVRSARKTLEGFCEEELICAIERRSVFSYIDDASSRLVPDLRAVVVEKALRQGKEGDRSAFEFETILEFEEEASGALREEIVRARERFGRRESVADGRRTWPVYEFVREELGTAILTGEEVSPGEYIEKVYEAMKEEKIGEVIVKCLREWRGAPTGGGGPLTAAAVSPSNSD